MKKPKPGQLWTSKEIADQFDTYSKIVVVLAEHHGIPYHTAAKGSMRLFDREAVEQLAKHVRAWKERVRVTQPRVTA